MKFGRYEILEGIGKGSMGVVYRARDPQIDRIIALKVLRHDRVISEDFVQRFLREAKAIGRLSHPAIVTVYDVGEDKGTVYLAMEFLEGTSLDRIIDGKKLSLEEIVNMGIQVAEALNYAHDQGVVHRDIKPANIILTPAGRIKITDFGLARIDDPLATRQTQAGEILGTPSYMAPEQVMSQPVDGRSDLYSFGVILYELTTGIRPFKDESLAGTFRAITQDTPTEPPKVDPTVSPALSALVMKSLNKLPDKRFQTGKEMAEALRGLTIKKPGKTVSPAVLKKPLSKKMSKWPLLLFFSILVAVVATLLYLYPRTSIMLESEPEGAQIYVDDILKGETPLLLKLKQGAYYLRIVKELYKPWQKKIFLKRGSNEPLRAELILYPQTSMMIESEPKGAEIYVDDILKGETPLLLKLKSGAHALRIVKELYKPWEKKIFLKRGRNEPLRAELTMIKSSQSIMQALLKVDSLPSGAQFFLDGSLKGETPYQLKLPIGKYEVRLVYQDHYDWKAPLQIDEEGEIPLFITLLPK
jgi:serine/threonine-protein kinase